MIEAASRPIEPEIGGALSRLRDQPTYGAYVAVSDMLDGAAAGTMPPLHVSLLTNFTVDALVPVMKGEIALAGFHPAVHVAAPDTILQESLERESGVYRSRPEVVVVALWLEGLTPALTSRFMALSEDEARSELERVLNLLDEIVSALRFHTEAPILINNFPLTLYPVQGILDAQSENSQTQLILALNQELVRRVRRFPDVYLVDYMSLFARIGGAQAIDERFWQIGRAPLGRGALMPLGQLYGRYFKALRGRNRKCLVLDCDNTLWGGVVGEDGMGGLRLGVSYPGSSYQAFQREILNLHDRGVILALCSKNNESDVLNVLRNHPDMLLREEHFAAWRINWDNKAENLRRLAEDLSIDLGSMVFLDDSGFECSAVRRQLPEVAVLHLRTDPSTFKHALSAVGFFDTLSTSAEDRRRNQMYQADRERKQAYAQSHGSLDEFLASLEMVAEIGLADDLSITRTSQLTQRTNQFNLTCRRYTESEVRAFLKDPNSRVFSLRLRDRISDLGQVGAAIVIYDGPTAEIDTFLLSCRALSRGAEDALLSEVVRIAGENGCCRVLGRYVRSSRNAQNANFYPSHGFTAIAGEEPGTTWELAIQTGLVKPPPWIRIEPGKSERGRGASI